MPKLGQQVQWKALPGYVDGEVVEVVYEEKEVEGKAVKTTEEDSQLSRVARPARLPCTSRKPCISISRPAGSCGRWRVRVEYRYVRQLRASDRFSQTTRKSAGVSEPLWVD